MTRADGTRIPFLPTPRADLESIFWTLGFRGRPAVILAGVLEELIDASSVGGCVFDIGSATYGITRILTGQLDAYVDIGPAIITAHPWTEAEFRRVGRGAVLCNSPYDVAAAYLLCKEAGLPFCDADGSSLDHRPVLGSDASFQMATVVSGNSELQAALLETVQRGIAGLRRPEVRHG
jgi:myo-inositol-1(or 4)-monophosphatase